MFADGFHDAIIGIDTQEEPYRIVYCRQKMIDIFMKSDDISYEDSVEYLSFNCWSAYVGSGTPLYIESADYEEALELVLSSEDDLD